MDEKKSGMKLLTPVYAFGRWLTNLEPQISISPKSCDILFPLRKWSVFEKLLKNSKQNKKSTRNSLANFCGYS